MSLTTVALVLGVLGFVCVAMAFFIEPSKKTDLDMSERKRRVARKRSRIVSPRRRAA